MNTSIPGCKYNFVMLIDDNELDNFINENVIAANRFAGQVYVNVSGTSALEFLSGKKETDVVPDVIFIDLNMPIMDGFQFLENLKAIDEQKFKTYKLVVLTSSVYEEDYKRANEISPGILFFHKPLTGEILEKI